LLACCIQQSLKLYTEFFGSVNKIFDGLSMILVALISSLDEALTLTFFDSL